MSKWGRGRSEIPDANLDRWWTQDWMSSTGWYPCGQVLRVPGRVLRGSMSLSFFAILLQPGIFYPGQTHIHECRSSCQHASIRELSCIDYAWQTFSWHLTLFKLNLHNVTVTIISYYRQENRSMEQYRKISSITTSQHLRVLTEPLWSRDNLIKHCVAQETWNLDVTPAKT